jgi:glutamine amidotransferase
MAKIAVVDYGAGNLTSVSKALELTGAEVDVTSEGKIIEKADGVVLPGVGSFGDAISRLRDLGLVPVLEDGFRKNKPFLGICLGFQMLFTESEEEGRHLGLNWFPGQVRKFRHGLKIPQVGWNRIRKVRENPLFFGVPDQSFFYFVHSYYVDSEEDGIVAARTDYGGEFVSMIQHGNIFAMQFHPEKSGDLGQVVLKNFYNLVRSGGDRC